MSLSLPVGRTRVAVAAGAVALILALAFPAYLTTPRTEGLDGDWSARSLSGPVVADRAILSGSNAALDLRTGKTVTLGSVRGGTPFVADDRLLIASPGRIDSTRLDATARWTWQAPAGRTATPVAAAGGSTLVLVCPATGTCALVGLDARGREVSRADGVARRTAAPSHGSLPRVDASPVNGGGVLVTDPTTGRTALRAGRSFVAVPDGPVVTELVQDGQCVVSAYAGADELWVKVLDACPDTQPKLAVADGAVSLTWPGRTERLALTSGAAPATQARVRIDSGSRLVARAAGMVAVESRKSLHTNPFRWGTHVTVIQLRDTRTGDKLAQVVSDQPLTVLHLERGAVVVRDGDRIVRYTLEDRDRVA